MKRPFFILLLLLSFIIHGQEAKFGIRSIGQSMGLSTTLTDYYDPGVNLGLHLTADYQQHLFAIRFDFGGEVNIILDYGVNEYHNLSLMYGRELVLKKWLVLEGFIGLGYVNYIRNDNETDWVRQNHRNASFPLSLNILVVNGRIFGLGINPNMNINSFRTLYSLNLTLQFKLR